MKKIIIMILMALILVSEGITGVNAKSVYADQIGLDYAHTEEPKVVMSFSGKSIKCTVSCALRKASSEISGKMKLRDLTADSDVANWVVTGKGAMRASKTAKAVKGHSYRLTFTGTVKTAKGQKEQVSVSTEKTY